MYARCACTGLTWCACTSFFCNVFFKCAEKPVSRCTKSLILCIYLMENWLVMRFCYNYMFICLVQWFLPNNVQYFVFLQFPPFRMPSREQKHEKQGIQQAFCLHVPRWAFCLCSVDADTLDTAATCSSGERHIYRTKHNHVGAGIPSHSVRTTFCQSCASCRSRVVWYCGWRSLRLMYCTWFCFEFYVTACIDLSWATFYYVAVACACDSN